MSNSADIRLIRKANLELLVEHFGSVAKLNLAVGRKSKDVTFSQIRHGSVHPITKIRRQMGTNVARKTEKALRLVDGWLDKAHTLPEITTLLNPTSLSSRTVTVPVHELLIENLSASVISDKLELTESFATKQLGDFTNKESLRYFVPNRNLLNNTLPVNSIVILDSGITSFSTDGVYLIQSASGLTMLRRISALADGSYLIEADNTQETYATVKSLMILGRVIYVFCAKSL